MANVKISQVAGGEKAVPDGTDKIEIEEAGGTSYWETLASIFTSLQATTLGANTFTALQTITQASANAGILASTGYSLTGSDATSMIDLAGTWNTTGTPTALKLAITNTASNAASLILDILGGASGTTSYLSIKADGNVGIGTTNPTAKLHVIGTSLFTTGLATFNGSDGAGASLRTLSGIKFGGNSDLIGASSDYGYFVIGTSPDLRFTDSEGINPKMTILSTGNVGIGTTSPTAVLHLKAGTATASTAPLKFTAGTNLSATEAGAMEWDGTNLFITQSDGTRKTIAYV